jgi:hypothetical protein
MSESVNTIDTNTIDTNTIDTNTINATTINSNDDVEIHDEKSDDKSDEIEVKFGANDSDEDDESDEEDEPEPKKDLSKYTVVDADHLYEDPPLKGQEYALFSFLSPEGIMNCNVRAVKFRGAFPTIEKAKEYCAELEHKDKYFKIFLGETGKWLDFDPPSEKVEQEVTSNKKHQKIIDAQREQRMKKMNELAGKHKEMIDKKDNGNKERIKENKKSGAAERSVNTTKSDSKKVNKEVDKNEKVEKVEKVEKKEKKETATPTSKQTKGVGLDAIRERMRNNLAMKNAKKADSSTTEGDLRVVGKVDESNSNENKEKLNEKVKLVGEASEELETKKAKLGTTEKNIENIKKLIEKRKQSNKQ